MLPTAAPLHVEQLDMQALAALLQAPPSPSSLVAHVLRAHALAALMQLATHLAEQMLVFTRYPERASRSDFVSIRRSAL